MSFARYIEDYHVPLEKKIYTPGIEIESRIEIDAYTLCAPIEQKKIKKNC